MFDHWWCIMVAVWAFLFHLSRFILGLSFLCCFSLVVTPAKLTLKWSFERLRVFVLFQWALLLETRIIIFSIDYRFNAISQKLMNNAGFSYFFSKQLWRWARWTPERCWKELKLCWGRMESYGASRESPKSSGEELFVQTTLFRNSQK